ncbi:hypothetical protein QJQ45_025133 [Haematococcus lacustris]|nr:hypothetical protein QJQ45_025133 [Haematococcus lacustris]
MTMTVRCLARFTALVLAVFAVASQQCQAHPELFVDSYAKSCTDHPQQGYGAHRAPAADNSITFKTNTNGRTAKVALCRNTANMVQLQLVCHQNSSGRYLALHYYHGFPCCKQVTGLGFSEYLLTASAGSFNNAPSPLCPNRLVGSSRVSSVTAQLTLPCNATGSVTIQITAASTALGQYRTATTTLPIEPSCGDCPAQQQSAGNVTQIPIVLVPAPAPIAANASTSPSASPSGSGATAPGLVRGSPSGASYRPFARFTDSWLRAALARLGAFIIRPTMEASTSKARWELENEVQTLDETDALFRYDAREQQLIQQQKPWSKNPHHFKHDQPAHNPSFLVRYMSSVRMSALALLKMAMHARSGGNLEVGDGRGSPAQPSPAQPSPAQPSPAQPSPAQPSPAQPSPAQPSPAQPSPAQPSPAQPSPAQPSPAQPSPAQPSPAQPSPAQPSPAQPSPAQPSPAQPSPAQPSPAQPSPAQPSPAQPSPAQPSPAQPSPAQPSPAQPSPAQPSPAQPSPAQPSPAQPSPAQPSPAQPSPAQPSPAQPSPAQPSPAQPSPAQPSPAQPSPAQPSPAQPSPAQPSPAQPSPAQPHATIRHAMPRQPVMGILQGKIQGDTFIVIDTFALPVEGTETRVNAQAEAYEFMAVHRLENAVGWYHSHPGYGCWLSGIDCATQMLNQQFQEPFLAVVVDPVRTMASGKVEIGAFRTYPEGYKPPDEGPSEYQTIPLSKIEDFGVHAKQYYSLDITYFKSSADTQLLDLLWNKYWVSTLSASPLLNNREFAAGQISDIAEKLEQAEQSLSGASRFSRMGMGVGDKGKKGAGAGEETALHKICRDTSKLAAEQLKGLSSQLVKQILFNCQLTPAAANPQLQQQAAGGSGAAAASESMEVA